jgi:hypothetical protein
MLDEPDLALYHRSDLWRASVRHTNGTSLSFS